jgi:hypothetical protein
MPKITKEELASQLVTALEELDVNEDWDLVNQLVDDVLCTHFPTIKGRDDVVLFVRSMREHLDNDQCGRFFGLLNRGLEDLNTANSFWG